MRVPKKLKALTSLIKEGTSYSKAVRGDSVKETRENPMRRSKEGVGKGRWDDGVGPGTNAFSTT